MSNNKRIKLFSLLTLLAISTINNISCGGKSQENDDDIKGSAISHFVVSGDNKHAYIFSKDKGLYHSSDNGDSWKLLGDNGVLSGKVDESATASGEWDSKAQELADIKPTSKGAVASTNNGIWLIESDKVIWAIDKTVNETDIIDLTDKNIKSIDVVDINSVETIVFTQDSDLSNNNTIWLKPTDNDVKYSNASITQSTKPLNIKISKINTVKNTNSTQFIRASNTYNGNLLLTERNSRNAGFKIWQINSEELPANDGTVRATDVTVVNDTPVLQGDKSKRNLDKTNEQVNTIGSFNHNGTEIFYAGTNAVSDKSVGSIIHTDPKDTDKVIRDDSKGSINIYNIKQIFGKWVATSDKGVLGLNSDASFNDDENILLSKLDDKFDSDDDKKLRDVFGDDELAWFWIKDDALEHAGIHVIKKITSK